VSDERRTLVLMRHAKSAYPDGVSDHDRPLAARGEREAGLAGAWLRSGSVEPPVQAVLCSTATRTRQTLSRTGVDAPVHYADRLYGATPGAVIDEITNATTTLGIDVHTLLVVGHEPAMSQVALALAGVEGTNIDAAQEISMKFPTSALATLRITGPWTSVELGGAALTAFYVPR
jgi:phosphohistidine phosphatase